ncbi:MSP domain-containing protein [Arthroderma uncinatum]|uniref:MSP domain-containing protein n=1 Tax=Arthroderma uncinatum TaxID=74035 RepID=UPI00144AAA77|nr:MSP domain-containing protein [Arthroderma uncinatum]KAF3491903.1 MSP domain-containing protein [Arthroderma uncinatum]
MSVEIEPAELGFQRPFTKEVSETLYLRNPNSDPVAFKVRPILPRTSYLLYVYSPKPTREYQVKTTAPKHYCVRPNSGRIEPGKQVEVQVLLQAMKEEPPLDAKCRDKFLVQSVAVSADKEFSNVASIWQDVEKKSKSLIQERKIRVNFLPSESSHTNGVEHDAEPPSHPSPQPPQFTTPIVHRTHAPTTTGSRTPPRSEDLKQESASETSPETGSNTFSAANMSSRTEPSQTSDDLVSSQLAEARLQIEQLQRQIADNELRQRKKPAEGGESASGQSSLKQAHPPAQLAAAGGVPLQAVAALCLLSFLLAYIFF